MAQMGNSLALKISLDPALQLQLVASSTVSVGKRRWVMLVVLYVRGVRDLRLQLEYTGLFLRCRTALFFVLDI